MRRENKKQLNQRQEEILKDFIKTFLPPTGKGQRHAGNELEYMQMTLDKVFIQNAKFNLSTGDIYNAFKELHYYIQTRKGAYNDEHDVVPSIKGELIKGNDVYNDLEASFIYFDIEAATMRHLRKATARLPENTKLDKYARTVVLRENLKKFFAEKIN